MLYELARSLLFRLDAERAHELTLQMLERFPGIATAAFAASPFADPVELMGLRFPNRVGLAAGLDKNADCLAAWARLGFGFVEVGTVTPRPQPGNPRPRMFRLERDRAFINRLGFNNRGVDALLSNVARADFRGVLGINIGKNADTPIERAADDYLFCLRKVYAAASYVTVNISSPNTRNLRDLQAEAPLSALLAALMRERDALAQAQGRQVPLVVKIAPDVDDTQLAVIARLAREHRVDGLIATNTTVTRPSLRETGLAGETGGLSGAPLRPLAERVLRDLRAAVGADYPLIGVGGIVGGEDARARRAAGAQLLQIYSGFIFRGPALIAECAQAAAGAST